MVYTCFLCKKRSDKHPQRSYHKFPSKNVLKQKWLDVLEINDAPIGTRTTLCSLHFEKNCFRHGLVYGRKVLKKGSLPTLNLKKHTKKAQTKSLINRAKLPKSLKKNTLHTRKSMSDNVQMKNSPYQFNIEDNSVQDSSSEIDVENYPIDFPKENYLPKGWYKKSTQSERDVMLCLKKKILTLQHTLKCLRSSKRQMKLKLAVLTKMIKEYAAEN